MNTTKSIITTLFILFVFLGKGSVGAIPLIYSYEGTVTNVDSSLNDYFAVDDSYRLQVAIDSLTPDRDVYGSERGEYSISSATLIIGDYTQTTTVDLISVFNYSAYDGLRVDLHEFDLTLNGLQAYHLESELVDYDHTLFTDDTLLTSAPVFSEFENAWFSFAFEDVSMGPFMSGYVYGNVESLSINPVPEPNIAFLLGFALVGLAVFRWKKFKGERSLSNFRHQ